MTQRWTIAFDADDTLWHNERDFQGVAAEFERLLAEYCPPEDLGLRLRATEARNLRSYGYGVKGYTLSLIETALEVSQGTVPAAVIGAILALGRDMLDRPVELLPHVPEVLSGLSGDSDLIVITKGDLLHQETKVARSGLGEMFRSVEIVSEKTAATYQHIFARFDSARTMMVGNSLKSDVIPALQAGAWGIWVSGNLTWEHENAAAPTGHPRYHEIADMGQLPDLIRSLDG